MFNPPPSKIQRGFRPPNPPPPCLTPLSPTILTIIDTYFMKMVMFLEKYENSFKCAMNVPTVLLHHFFINRKSFAENHALMRSTKFDPISCLIFFKSQYLETFKGVITIKYFLKKGRYFGKHFERNYHKNAF